MTDSVAHKREREYDFRLLKEANDILKKCGAEKRVGNVKGNPTALANHTDDYHKVASHDEVQTLGISYDHFIPLPLEFRAICENSKDSPRMGLLPEIHQAWFGIGNKLYLWDYESKDQNIFYECGGFTTGDTVLDVGICIPKAEVFASGKAEVSFLLVVASVLEVSLFSVVAREQMDARDTAFQIVRTPFRVPSNGVLFTVLCSSDRSVPSPSLVGRICLAGSDGNLYQMHYSRAYQESPVFSFFAANLWAAEGTSDSANAAAAAGDMTHPCKIVVEGRWDSSSQYSFRSMLPSFLQPAVGPQWYSALDIENDFLAQGQNKHILADALLDNKHGVALLCSTSGLLSAFQVTGYYSSSEIGSKVAAGCCGSFFVLRELQSELRRDVSYDDEDADSWKAVTVSNLLLIFTDEDTAMIAVVLNNGYRVYVEVSPTKEQTTDISDGKVWAFSFRIKSFLKPAFDFVAPNAVAFYNEGVYLIGGAAAAAAGEGKVAKRQSDGVMCFTLEPPCLPYSSQAKHSDDETRKRAIVSVPFHDASSNGKESVSLALKDSDADGGQPYLRGVLKDIRERAYPEGGLIRVVDIRQFLVLEQFGVHVLAKRRPHKYMQELLEEICANRADKKQLAQGNGKLASEALKRHYEGLRNLRTTLGCSSVEFSAMLIHAIVGDDRRDVQEYTEDYRGGATSKSIFKNLKASVISSSEGEAANSSVVKGAAQAFAADTADIWNTPICTIAARVRLETQEKRSRFLNTLRRYDELLRAEFDIKVEALALYRLVLRTVHVLEILDIIAAHAAFPLARLEGVTLQNVVVEERWAEALVCVLRLGLRDSALENSVKLCQVLHNRGFSFIHEGDVAAQQAYLSLRHGKVDWKLVERKLMIAARYWRQVSDVVDSVDKKESNLRFFCNLLTKGAASKAEVSFHLAVKLCFAVVNGNFKNTASQLMCTTDSHCEERLYGYGYHTGSEHLAIDVAREAIEYCYQVLQDTVVPSGLAEERVFEEFIGQIQREQKERTSSGSVLLTCTCKTLTTDRTAVHPDESGGTAIDKLNKEMERLEKSLAVQILKSIYHETSKDVKEYMRKFLLETSVKPIYQVLLFKWFLEGNDLESAFDLVLKIPCEISVRCNYFLAKLKGAADKDGKHAKLKKELRDVSVLAKIQSDAYDKYSGEGESRNKKARKEANVPSSIIPLATVLRDTLISRVDWENSYFGLVKEERMYDINLRLLTFGLRNSDRPEHLWGSFVGDLVSQRSGKSDEASLAQVKEGITNLYRELNPARAVAGIGTGGLDETVVNTASKRRAAATHMVPIILELDTNAKDLWSLSNDRGGGARERAAQRDFLNIPEFLTASPFSPDDVVSSYVAIFASSACNGYEDDKKLRILENALGVLDALLPIDESNLPISPAELDSWLAVFHNVLESFKGKWIKDVQQQGSLRRSQDRFKKIVS